MLSSLMLNLFSTGFNCSAARMDTGLDEPKWVSQKKELQLEGRVGRILQQTTMSPGPPGAGKLTIIGTSFNAPIVSIHSYTYFSS